MPIANDELATIETVAVSTLPTSKSTDPSGVVVSTVVAGIDAGNSTAVALGISGTFTGVFKDVSNYSNVSVLVFTDQVSATDGLKVEYSTDGTNVDDDDFYTLPASNGQQFSFPLTAKFYRVRYTNGAVAQTAFRMQAKLHSDKPKASSHRLSQILTDETDVEVVKSVLAIKSGTNFVNLSAGQTTMANALPVAFSSDQTSIPVAATLSAETTKVIGTVNIAAAQTLATVTTVSAVTAITNALPTGANTIGAVNIAAAQTLATVTTVGTVNAVTAITNALPTGANTIGTVNPPAITKGTQGATGVSTQDLKDAGRNAVHYYTIIPVLSTATDTLQSLTGTKAGATVVATTTVAVVTTGKTFRVTRVAATYISTAVSGYGMVRLRFNTAGVVAITSPIAATLAVGSGAPVTANAANSVEASFSEAIEFVAATGIGISVQGFAAVTPAAVGYVLVSLTGYEY